MTWQETAQDYYDHNPRMNDQNRAWLQANVRMECPLLQELTRDQLIALFTASGAFSSAWLLRTLVWQTAARTLCGDIRGPSGNIRSFWYEVTAPVFTQFELFHHAYQDPAFLAYAQALSEDFPYDRYTAAELVRRVEVSRSYAEDLTEDCLADFVLQRIWTYQEPFLFDNPSRGYQIPGTQTASLVLVVEKEGLFDRFCAKYNAKYKITVMASNGNPSWCAMEYLSEQLRARKIKNVRLATLVDYDPGGWCIAADYPHKFETYGFHVKSNTMVTRLSLFTDDDLAHKADDLTNLKPGHQKLADEWFAKTNGIHGRKAGIHFNLAVDDRVDEVVKAWYKANASLAETEDYE